MIKHSKGRARSERSVQDLEDSLRQDIENLSPEERETLRIMLGELDQPMDDGERVIDIMSDAEWERSPVDMETFIRDPYYLGSTCSNLYPQLFEDLVELFEGEYNEAILTGSIGWGKTFFASIGICRVLYELSCMRNPQESFGLASGSVLAITNMSVNETLARKVVFENIATKIKLSRYFQENFPFDPTAKEIRFPKQVQLIARATTDTSVLGLNTIAAIMDETNFMAQYSSKKRAADGRRLQVVDQAETIYASIKRRMKSRFAASGKLPGILFMVSSKKTNNDFTARRVRESMHDQNVFVRDYSLWDVKPQGHYSDKKFFVLAGNENVPSRILDPGEEERYSDELTPENCVLIEVPIDFKQDFELDLEGSIRDIAGVATVAVNPYIQRREKIHDAVDKDRKHPFSTMVYDPSRGGKFLWHEMVEEKLVRVYNGSMEPQRRPILNPDAPRHIHIDPSLTGDATGFCMAHISGFKPVIRRTEDGRQYPERAPMYVVDLIMQIVPPIGGEIVLGDMRHLVYDLTAHGYMITCVSLDSFQSADTIQQLKSKGYRSEVLSVDLQPEPYDNLKMALYEGRVSYYPYPPLLRELETLQEDRTGRRRKIDHPVKGSKDCSDALAGVLSTLSKRSINEPLPLIQSSSYASDPWMPEQQQAALASRLESSMNETLPPIILGEGSTWGGDGWIIGGPKR